MGKPLAETGFRPVKVLAKTFALLEYLQSRDRQSAPLKEISAAVGLPKPTACRLLRTLEELDFLEHEPASGSYRPTDKLRHLGYPSSAGLLADLSRPALTRLVAEFEQTVNLAVVDRGRLIYKDVVEGLRAVRMRPTPGVFLDWERTALGRCILAFLPRPVATSYLNAGRPSVRNRGEQAWARMKHIRGAGYALDLEESEPGLCCVGAPVFGKTGLPIAAISISGGSGVMNQRSVPRMGRRLLEECRSISIALGCPEPALPAARRSSSA